jgi:hypothetical protein
MPGIDVLRFIRPLALVAAAFVLLVNSASAQGLTPAAIVEGYERESSQSDLQAAVNRFGDSAVVTVYGLRTRQLLGRDKIREYLEESSGKPAPSLTSMRHVDGNTVTWTERTAATELSAARDVTVEATVDGGKIQSLVYRPGRSARLAGAPATSVSPGAAALALGGLLLLGLGLLTLATARQGTLSHSSLRGRLMLELASYTPRRNAPTASANGSGASS